MKKEKPRKTRSFVEHMITYSFLSRDLHAKRVLELGCGEGYGLQLLSLFALRLQGLDNSPKFLRRAQLMQYHCPTVLKKIDLDKDLPDLSEVDFVVATELLEHLEDAHRMVEHCARSGVSLGLSIPHNAPHPLHKHVFMNPAEAKALISPHYRDVRWFTLRNGIVQKDFPFISPERYIGICSPSQTRVV